MNSHSVDVRKVIKEFESMFCSLGFHIVRGPVNNFIFVDNEERGDGILITKPQRLHMLSCLLKKKNGHMLFYSIDQLVKVFGTDEEKKEIAYSDGYFYYDTVEDVQGIMKYIINILLRFSEKFFKGDLEEEVYNHMIKTQMEAKEKKLIIGKEEFVKVSLESSNIWKIKRFSNSAG